VILPKWPKNSVCRVDRLSKTETIRPGETQQRSPRQIWRRTLGFLAARPLARAFLWGLASALALPPLHLLPVLLFSIPAFLALIGGAKTWKHVALIGWMFGFGLNLGGLYWITEPILTEASTFWWLVPFAAPLLACAVAFYSIIPALAAYLVRDCSKSRSGGRLGAIFCAPVLTYLSTLRSGARKSHPADSPERLLKQSLKKPDLGQLLVFSGAWVLSNLIQQFAFSGFPWNLWGTDWAIPGILGDIFIQPAAIFGVHGLTLLTVFLAGLPQFRRRGFLALIAILLAWAGFGAWRLQTPVQPTGVKLALLQPDFPVPGAYDRASLVARWQRLLSMSNAGIHAGATAIIWPEAASPWLLDTDIAARQQLAQVTGTTPILAGSLRAVSDTDYRNALVVTAGPMPALAVYDKWKLVPFGEYMPKWIPVKITPDVLGSGFTPGPGPKTLHIPGLPPFGPLICYEDVFTGQVVDEKDRPDWLLNITDDAWFGDSAGPRQHFADARLRAVEEGLPLARDANSGISTVFNAFGHVEPILPLNSQAVLVIPLPGHLPATLFSRLGLSLPAMVAAMTVAIGLLIALTV
jgi:apolipoprotein N-acyltransferase